MLICAHLILDIIVASYYLPWISSYYFVGWIVSLTLVGAFSFFARRVEFQDKNRSTGRTVLSESYHRFVTSRRGLVVLLRLYLLHCQSWDFRFAMRFHKSEADDAYTTHLPRYQSTPVSRSTHVLKDETPTDSIPDRGLASPLAEHCQSSNVKQRNTPAHRRRYNLGCRSRGSYKRHCLLYPNFQIWEVTKRFVHVNLSSRTYFRASGQYYDGV